jgi:hypothetical protein
MDVVGGGKSRNEPARRIGSIFESVAISSSKGNRQTRPAIMLTETNKNTIAAKSKQ